VNDFVRAKVWKFYGTSYLTTIFEQLYETMTRGRYKVAGIDLAATTSIATAQPFGCGRRTWRTSSNARRHGSSQHKPGIENELTRIPQGTA
jgi:hypothetical protein